MPMCVLHNPNPDPNVTLTLTVLANIVVAGRCTTLLNLMRNYNSLFINVPKYIFPNTYSQQQKIHVMHH